MQEANKATTSDQARPAVNKAYAAAKLAQTYAQKAHTQTAATAAGQAQQAAQKAQERLDYISQIEAEMLMLGM